MFLVKSCHAEDHILKRGTVKIGSLYEYREIEQKELIDKLEGTLTFHIKFEGVVEVSRKLLNEVFRGSIFIGPEDNEASPSVPKGYYEAHIPSFCQVGRDRDKDTILIKDTNATIKQQSHNSFIFCMSQVDNKGDAEGIFPNYNDYWHINKKDFHEFGVTMAAALVDKIKSEHAKSNYILPANTNLATLQIGYRFEEVNYVPREIHLSNSSELTLADVAKSLSLVDFTKPPVPFAKEKEFRFTYIFISDKKELLEPLVKWVSVDAAALKKFLV